MSSEQSSTSVAASHREIEERVQTQLRNTITDAVGATREGGDDANLCGLEITALSIIAEVLSDQPDSVHAEAQTRDD